MECGRTPLPPQPTDVEATEFTGSPFPSYTPFRTVTSRMPPRKEQTEQPQLGNHLQRVA